MSAIAFIAVAALATLARAIFTTEQTTSLPWRTLVVNTAGAFALGVILLASWFDDPWILTVAGLGSLTTFSTVAAETASLLDDGHKRRAIAYVGITLAAGVAAAWLGLALGESFV